MPSSRLRTRVSCLLVALCAGGGFVRAAPPAAAPARPAARAAAQPGAQASYTFDAASSEIDYKAHTGAFKQITIAQGRITVTADQAHASGLGQPSGEWTLQGHVHIHAPPHGSLSSDQAVVEIAGNRINQVTVTGKPAQFTQQGMVAGRIAQGHADQIVYDVRAGTVQLNHDAWLSDGHNAFSAPQLVYNILKDRIEATSGGDGERVHVTIAPQAVGTPLAQPPAAAKPHPPGRSS